MRDHLFQASVLILLAVLAVGVFLHAENGHYQFATSNPYRIVLNTRTGEYWTNRGTHVRPTERAVQTSTDSEQALDFLPDQAEPPNSNFWTGEEEAHYLSCLPHSISVWKNIKEAIDSCLVEEEHSHWLHQHAVLAGKKENTQIMQDCIDHNAAQINGDLVQFRLAFDRCEDRAYGISN